MAEPGGANLAHARPQFGLKSIFAFVTWASAIAALAASRFDGYTMLACAGSVGALNASGRLKGFQSGNRQANTFRLGWLLLAASLFLPAMQGCGNQGIPGWQAAIGCCQLMVDPPLSDAASRWQSLAYLACLTLGNVLLLGSPLLLWRLRCRRGRLYSTLLAMSLATICALATHEQNHLLAGYYVWCLSGLALLCACPIGWATVALMAFTALLACLRQAD